MYIVAVLSFDKRLIIVLITCIVFRFVFSFLQSLLLTVLMSLNPLYIGPVERVDSEPDFYFVNVSFKTSFQAA